MSGSNAPENSGLAGLPYTVIRIRAGDPVNHSQFHTGTGFFYQLSYGEQKIQLIVSNKHVLCNKTWIELDFGLGDVNQVRVLGPPKKFRIDPGQLPIFEHPDAQVDLAAIPLGPIITKLSEAGAQPHTLFLSKDIFPPPNIRAVLHVSTSVLMVGFPNGIMDEANNLPVVRRGSLATPYKADYQGQANFVVDIAAFGGSSGSPVFAFFDGMIPTDEGGMNFVGGPSFSLIGVLHSGPVMTAQGQIIQAPVPTNHFVSQTAVMIHLGYCLKAHRIEELITPILPFLLPSNG
jgi:hypothetical protein